MKYYIQVVLGYIMAQGSPRMIQYAAGPGNRKNKYQSGRARQRY